MDKTGELVSVFGYEFSHANLLHVALTHRSVSGKNNNERLEFLGDAVLGLIIAAELYQRFPEASEGELTRLRAKLVNKDQLAELARKEDLGPLIALGSGEKKSGGSRRSSILADTLEAIIGAIYLDGGMDVCTRHLLGIYEEALTGISPLLAGKDPKTRLQEWMQSRKAPLPDYKVTQVSGEAHSQDFTVECQATGMDDPVFGSGSSIKRAEQAAAEKALTLLGVK